MGRAQEGSEELMVAERIVGGLTEPQRKALAMVVRRFDERDAHGPFRVRVSASGPEFTELARMGLLVDTRTVEKGDVTHSAWEAYVPTEAGRAALPAAEETKT
jgi:hypothetical protein